MAKFIIEVDDAIIRQEAAKIRNRVDRKEWNKDTVLDVAYEYVALTAVQNKLDEGQTEFHVSREKIDDDIFLALFDASLASICIIAGIPNNKAEKETK